jgi:methionyl-tRNA formyltransferase
MLAVPGPRSPVPGPRCLVFGYHTMGCLGFDALLRHGFEIAAVFTHRDDPHEEIWWESLSERAASIGIPVHFPDKADLKTPAFADLVASTRPAFIFSFYFRWLIPSRILELAPRGAFNLHGSLLPRYRGRAPVNWVLVNGESETGVTLHAMVAKADAGAIVDQERVAVAFEDTALTLYHKLEVAAARLLDRALPALRDGTVQALPMDLAEGSYFGGRTPEDGRIDWSWPAVRIYNLIRAVTHPYPGAFTTDAGRKVFVWWGTPETGVSADGAALARHGARVGFADAMPAPGLVLALDGDGVRVATGGGVLVLRQCQTEGGAQLPAAEWAATSGVGVGHVLGT